MEERRGAIENKRKDKKSVFAMRNIRATESRKQYCEDDDFLYTTSVGTDQDVRKATCKGQDANRNCATGPHGYVETVMR